MEFEISNSAEKERSQVIAWTLIKHYTEPNWEVEGIEVPATLFWRRSKGAILGFIREGELFDHKFIYVCDANKVTHFAFIQEPEGHKDHSVNAHLQSSEYS